MVRIVLDTNVVVSALIGKGSPKRILEAVFSGKATLCLSAATFAEYLEVLSRPKFIRYPEFSEAAVATSKHLRSLALFVEPTRRVSVCSDPDDDKFLELALETKAAYLITGNNHRFTRRVFEAPQLAKQQELFRLHKSSRFQPIEVTPQFEQTSFITHEESAATF
jgi:hypothetical protein